MSARGLLGTVRGNLGGFAKANPSATLAPEVITAAGKVLDQDWVNPTNVFLTTPKSAITSRSFPPEKFPGGLKEQEQKIYDLVLRRFVAIFYPSAEFENTRRITRIEQDSFLTTGKILSRLYLEVYGRRQGRRREG